jgi:hypothetical protein
MTIMTICHSELGSESVPCLFVILNLFQNLFLGLIKNVNKKMLKHFLFSKKKRQAEIGENPVYLSLTEDKT